MKDREYYLNKAAELKIGEEMCVNYCEENGGSVVRIAEDKFECSESTGYGSYIHDHGIRSLENLGEFIDEAMSWT
jgi:hypothetical protein